MFGGGGGGGGRQGRALLEARFHYQYQAGDGRLVRMVEGDRFVLLNKSNQDWWRVRREGEPKRSKPIYVPAAYVVELPEEAPAAAHAGKRASLPGKLSPSSLDVTGAWSGVATEKRSTLSGDPAFRHRFSWANLGHLVPQSPRASHLLTPHPSDRCRGNVAAIVHAWPPGTPVESRGQADGATDGECYVEPRQEPRGKPRPGSPVYTNLKELKLVVRPPPSPCGPPVQILDLWERHVCPETGRNFYLNSVTKERTWKPPRRTRNCAQSRSSTPPPDQPSPWNDGESSQAPSNRLELQQQNRKSWDTSQCPSSRMQRSTSSDSLGLAQQGGNDGRQVWRRQATVNWTSAAKVTMTREYDGQQVKGWRNQSQHSYTMGDSSPVTPPAEEKSGQLNKTKIAEGGRKLKKNWSSCWVVLAGNSLAFYKEAKSQGAGIKRAGNRPESSMDLRGALIEWTKEMSSKKHVFRIRTVTGNEFLLQSENEDYIRDWYRTIKSVIDTLDRENPLNYPLVYSLRRSASAELLDCSGDEDEVLPKDTKPKDSRRISLRRLNSDSSERKRVKNRIRKFISKRPPLQTLQEKGLIKDQVFGCRLDALCEREKSTVPKFVRMCIEAVEKRGLDVDGIYRVSGNLAIIQKLRFAVDHERAVTTDGRYLFPDETCKDKLNLDDPEWEDIHVVSGALKMFFRELPEPLIPYNTFEDFVGAVKLMDHSERVEVMKQLVGSLPKPNHDTMRALFGHMQRVVEHSQINRMSPQSLAIVFGPTLLRPEKDFLNMAVHTVYQNQVVELILIECASLFTQDGREP